MSVTGPITVLCILSFLPAFSQTSPYAHEILTNRLCRVWRIEKMVQGEKITMPDNIVKDFVLIFNGDHTVEQGMYPDGLIKGTWSLDDKTMMLSVKDDVTSSLYEMKIVSITDDELVLQDSSSGRSLTIYYRLK